MKMIRCCMRSWLEFKKLDATILHQNNETMLELITLRAAHQTTLSNGLKFIAKDVDFKLMQAAQERKEMFASEMRRLRSFNAFIQSSIDIIRQQKATLALEMKG
jgi:hypothetical protein